MDAYWAKIGLGAAAIFGVGMVGVTAAKKGVAELKTVASAPVQEALQRMPGALLNFRLDGRRVGQVRTIEVSNEGEWTANSVAMTVALESGRAPADLADCSLATEELAHRKDASFRCVTPAEIDDEGLVQIGEVRFEPDAVTRPLYVEQRQIRKLERSDLRGLKASINSTDGKSVHGVADFDVQTNHGRRERGTVKLDASDGRAVIEIVGEDGRELFRLRADEAGVSINAKDKRGANLLRLLAGDAGVHLDVKTDNK
ncbi:MAG: hypothetical protein IT352_07910 [Gemmatimonadales bacterium]|nr:hypothetical protein [Gemmatimonadales bacterium]